MATIEVTESELIAAILAASVPTETNPHGAKTTVQLRAEFKRRGEKHSLRWIREKLKELKTDGIIGMTEVLSESLNGGYQSVKAYYIIKE